MNTLVVTSQGTIETNYPQQNEDDSDIYRNG